MSGDAWRYCTKLDKPEAVKKLVQAALGAAATIKFARTKVNPEDFATVPDWRATQDALAITGEASSLGIAGSYKTVSVISKDTADIMLRNAAIENLEVRLDGGYVAAGVVRTLSVRQPGACPAREHYDDQNRVVVQAVSSGMLTYNGIERAAALVKNDCGVVIVGDEDSYDEQED